MSLTFITHVDADGRPTIIPIDFAKIIGVPEAPVLDVIRETVARMEASRHDTDLQSAIHRIFDAKVKGGSLGDQPDQILQRLENVIDDLNKAEEDLDSIEATLDDCDEVQNIHGESLPNRVCEVCDALKEKDGENEDMTAAIDEAIESLRRVNRG
jgi:DnaJ-domain-containing protein 1